MGLLDNLENQALGNVLGGSSNPLASGLLQMIRTSPADCRVWWHRFTIKGWWNCVPMG